MGDRPLTLKLTAPTSTAGTVTVDQSACTQISVNKKKMQKTCPGNTVMVAAISYGIATGSKEWHVDFLC